jgi:hypothetical protein
MFFKLIFIILFTLSYNIKASEITVIELHKNKSLDQLVLENENITENQSIQDDIEIDGENNTIDVLDSSEGNNSNIDQDDSVQSTNLEDGTDYVNLNSEEVTFIKSKNIFDTDEKILQLDLATINEIKSKTLNNEFLRVLSSSKSENKNDINKIFFVITKLYEIGEIQKAYNLIKEINLDLLSNKEHLVYFQVVELNYLLSTFKLSEVCELKNLLLEKSIVLPNFLLEKIDIFCLTLENKIAEAKLLNSLLKDSEETIDINFQKLFEYTILENKGDVNFESINLTQSRDLIFLYSAMLRINELPLTEDFIKIDPLNLSIPVILSDSTPMSIRIKAANKSFNDEVISVESLSALYQSVDFNSEQFNAPEQTILNLKENNELIMAFYYQLANMQIFPEDRLRVIIEYWQFSKNIGLDKIAYSVTKNIIESFTPTSENLKYSLQIALAHISNKNYDEASKWLNVSDNSEASESQFEYARFLIDLYETDDLNTIINFLNNINNNSDPNTNSKNIETIDILNRFLKIETNQTLSFNYEIISDDRTMPSYFLIRDIKKNISEQKNLRLFFLSIISMNNKNWHELC